MKLVTYTENQSHKTGLLIDDKIIDLASAACREGRPSEVFSDMVSILSKLDEVKTFLKTLKTKKLENTLHRETMIPAKSVKLVPPVPSPPKALISGPSWKQYVKNGVIPEFIFVIKPPTAIIGDGDTIRFPRNPEMIVTEVELAIVVGKPGRYISPEKAWKHIAGFTIFNDVTDMGLYQRRTPRAVIRAKSYDTFAAIGPCITLKESMGDLTNITLKLRINGEEKVNVSTSEMLYPMSHFISSVSEVMTLQTGDIISTGCPVWVPVQPGDEVEAEIQNIGVLRNRFVGSE